MIVSLVGYRGCGKSSLAPLIAEQLGCRFVDADRELEARQQRTIASLFANEGEAYFRQLEAELLAEFFQRGEPLVLATGGGAILNPQTRLMLSSKGLVIWLSARPETIAARLQQDPNTSTSRPALTNLSPTEEIAALLAKREPFYQEVSHLQVATDNRTTEQILQEIMTHLPGLLHIQEFVQEGRS